MQANPKRYSSGQFILSAPGILKIFSMICFLSSSIVFLSTPICVGTPSWYSTLYPITAASSGCVIAFMYVLFAIGIVKHGYAFWSLLDLLFNMFAFIVMLTVSIMTCIVCDRALYSTQLVPGPMGIIGALLLAASITVWFVKSRTTREAVLEVERDVKSINVSQYRKSVIV